MIDTGEVSKTWPAGSSEMSRMVRTHDWQATPLGPVERWPGALRVTVELALASPVPAIVLWGSSHVQIYNDLWITLHPDKHPGCLGAPTHESFPELVDVLEPMYQRVLVGEGVVLEDRFLAVQRTGVLENAWWDVVYTPIFDVDGAVGGIFCTLAETTAKVLAAGALQESESRFRALATTGVYIIYRMSADWRIMYQLDSETLASTTEPIEDWVGKYILEEDQPVVMAAIGRAIHKKERFALEHRVRLANGQVGWVLSRAVPLLGEDGEIVEWFGTGSDVSSRKFAEAALRDSEARHGYLLELSDALRPLSDTAAIQTEAMRLLGERLGASRAQYYTADENGEYLSSSGGYTDGVPAAVGRFRLSDFGKYAYDGFHAGQTQVVCDATADARISATVLESYKSLGFLSYVGVPFIKRGRLLGTVAVHQAGVRQWTDSERMMVEETAERAGVAIEQARTEKELRASEQRYQALFAGSPVPFMVLSPNSPDYTITAANDAYFAVTKTTREILIGKRLFEVFTDDPNRPGVHGSTALEISLAKVLATKKTDAMQRVRYDLAVPGGFEPHWWEAINAPVLDTAGEIVTIIHQVARVTELHLAEEAARQSEDRKAFLLRFTDELRPISDPILIQEVAMRVLGEHVGVDRAFYGEILPDNDTLRIGPGYSGGAPSLEGQVRFSDFATDMLVSYRAGETVVFHDIHTDARFSPASRAAFDAISVRAAIGVPLVKDGRVQAIVSLHQMEPRTWTETEVAFLEDIAERTWAAVERARIEAALRNSEVRFRLFVENVREYALIQTDFEGVITSWNPGAQRLFGYTRAEIIGRPFVNLMPEEDRHDGIIAREMAKLSRGEKNIEGHAVQRKDGSRFWAEWVTEPVLDDTGKLRGTAKVMRDETERQAAELTLRTSLAEKEELLKEVHHRVKNNLQVIVSLLNMQSSQITEKAILSQFQEARNRVLAISSIHELLYRAESFAGIVLTDYARKLAPGLLQFYGLDSRVNLSVTGDGNKLELERAVPFGMLLNELVSNACKHAFPAGRSGTLRISVDPEGDLLALTVADDGIGLPEGFRYEKASSLGLKLVHALARQLRGTVQVASEEGTVFRIRFPAIALEEA